MQLQMLTSSLNKEYHYIDRFNDIIRIALSLKATFYYADKSTNNIYGFYEDGHSVIETACPFPITNSVFFKGYGLPKEYINEYKTYFYRDDYPYLLLPENKRADMMNDNIIIRLPDNDISEAVMVDRMTYAPVESGFISYPYEYWFRAKFYIDILEAFRRKYSTCMSGIRFEDMHKDQTIMNVMSSKISQGAKLLVLNGNNRQYGLYVFKSLLGPLTKADTLSITIHDDYSDRSKFLVAFTVHKKKVKLDIPELTSMDITTYSNILNILM